MKTKIEYRVCSGNAQACEVAYNAVPTLNRARVLKKQHTQSNPHQGGGYHIVKVTTTYKEVK